jgi:mono/diheme cytochrome c family protein
VKGLWFFASFALASSMAACSRSGASETEAIEIKRDGKSIATLPLAAMKRAALTVEVSVYDPYYKRPKRFRAVPLTPILTEVFHAPAEALAKEHFLLRAKDGYSVPIAGERLFEPGAHLAFEDMDVAAWEPIGPQRANPGPFYLVWSGENQTDLEQYPRPWQLATIEIAKFETVFPHTAPGEGAKAREQKGYYAFRETCIRCHAMNREGGRVGPELNVPQSIVEYRPDAQIRAYIKNPLSFRYGNMPAHPQLTEEDLDGLIAYFHAMKARKYDPDAKAAK